MTPHDPISPAKLRFIHQLFRDIGPDAEDAVRGQIAELTGDTSSKSLSEAQAWRIIHGICEAERRNTPSPIVVTWCPVYLRGNAKLRAGNTVSFPSQRQVWQLFKLLGEAGVGNPEGFFTRRFKLKGGIIRTAEEAGRVIPALGNMARNRSQGRQAGADGF